jgi:hypothetical protein
MSNFITLQVVSFTPEKRAQPSPEHPEGQVMSPAAHSTFPMYVLPENIAGTNVVQEGPTESIQSIVYFDADSGLKPVLSTMTAEEVIAAVDEHEY